MDFIIAPASVQEAGSGAMGTEVYGVVSIQNWRIPWDRQYTGGQALYACGIFFDPAPESLTLLKA